MYRSLQTLRHQADSGVRLWRRGTFVCGGVLVALLLFLLMNGLISGRSDTQQDRRPTQMIDMVRLDDPEVLQIKQRIRPKKPPPPKQPPPPPRLQTPKTQPPRNLARIDMPKIDIPVVGGDGPYLGGWAPSEALEEGDAVPIVRIQPQWPQRALVDGTEGSVRVEILIGADGSVKDVQVLESTPGALFVRNTIRTVFRWKFKPRIVDGIAIERRAAATIDFKLND